MAVVKRRYARALAAVSAVSLKTRASLALAATLIAFTLAMAAADVLTSYRDVTRDLETQAETHARVIAELASQKLVSGDLAGLIMTAQSMAVVGNFGSIRIHDARTGQSLIAEQRKLEIVAGLESDVGREAMGAGRTMTFRRNNTVSSATPFGENVSPNAPRGVVVVTASAALYAQKQREAIIRSAVIGGVFIAILIPALGAIAGRFIQPIRELQDAMRRVAQGELDVTLAIDRRDEIGELARSFRHMTRRLKTLAAEERRLAYVDPVTGLANRERIQRAVESVAKRASLDLHPRALLFIDLDGFKRVNDVFGHDVGDKLLAAVGQRFLEVVADQGYIMVSPLGTPARGERESRYAFLGRQGGDEFVLVARCAVDGRIEGASLAAALIASLDQPFNIDGHAVDVGASIGIACLPDDGTDGRTVLRHADLAMYEAKDGGRGRYSFFTESMAQKMLDRLILEMELRRAVGNDEFEVVYMPKVELATGRMTGFEALARWQHPTKGLLQPAVFIPLAEETGLIDEIDRMVLRKALKQASEWAWNGTAVPVAVNMSAKDFARSPIVSMVARALKEAELPGRLLEIEITESAAMIDSAGAATVMGELKRLGVRFALDDFGTGFSNLGQLLKLPVDVFKIDRSFVQSIEANGEAHHLVRTIVGLAEQLGLETVAEGVETQEQAEVLARLGVSTGQGFLYGQPMTAAEAEPLLRRNFRAVEAGAWLV